MMRWTIRFLSLLQVIFYVSLWLFNEDVRSEPTPAILFQGLLTLALLVAWRWEKIGGRLVMFGGLLFFLMLIVGVLVSGTASFVGALLASAMLTLPYGALGWLFFKLGRQVEQDAVSQGET
jgi:Na+/melibiose symporter-like transporter